MIVTSSWSDPVRLVVTLLALFGKMNCCLIRKIHTCPYLHQCLRLRFMVNLGTVLRGTAHWIVQNKLMLSLLTAAIVVRVGLIEFIALENWIDLKIYRSAGALVVQGINPYSLVEGELPAVADSIRTSQEYFDPWASDLSVWYYYVSSNPPLSTLLWGFLEFMAKFLGAKLAFIYFFSFVDFFLFFIALGIVKAINGTFTTRQLIAVSGLTILNPLLLWWGTILPEDKQIQTVLILALILLLVRQRRNFFWIGLTSAALILFKVVGFPLLLWVVWRLISSRSVRNYVHVVLGALLPVALSFAVFGYEFVQVNVRRLGLQSGSGPAHDSFYVLFPEFTSGRLLISAFFALSGYMLSKHLPDLEFQWLFFLLWTSIAFTMIFLVNGSWDRQLMALLPIFIFLVAINNGLSWLLVLSSVAISSVYLVPTVIYYSVTEFQIVALSALASELIPKYAGPISSLFALFALVSVALYSALADRRHPSHIKE